MVLLGVWYSASGWPSGTEGLETSVWADTRKEERKTFSFELYEVNLPCRFHQGGLFTKML